AGGVCRPDVNPRRALGRSAQQCDIRISRIESACRKLVQTDLVQEKEGDEPVSGWVRRVELPLACNGPYRVPVVTPYLAHNRIVGEAGNALPRLVNQRI